MKQINGHEARVQAMLIHNHGFLDWQFGYHECERQWLCTARPMQHWFIITSVQGYGHVAQDSRNAGLWSWVCEGMGVTRDPHNADT